MRFNLAQMLVATASIAFLLCAAKCLMMIMAKDMLNDPRYEWQAAYYFLGYCACCWIGLSIPGLLGVFEETKSDA